MEKEKVYEIRNGEITVYVDHWHRKEFRFKGFTVDNDTENYFVESNGSNEFCPDGRNMVRLIDYLFQMYKSEADTQLWKYLKRNINRYDLYNEYSTDGFSLWNKIINTAGLDPIYRNYHELDLSEVPDGIVSIIINQIKCRYSFADKKTLAFIQPSYYDKPNLIKSAMDVFHRGRLTEYLALEQFKRGIAVPAYDELVRLREFLADKKSLRLVMKSGEVYHLIKDSLCVSDILKHFSDNGKLCFCLNNNYWLKPQMDQCLPLDQLDYLLFCKQKYYIDQANLLKYTNSNEKRGA